MNKLKYISSLLLTVFLLGACEQTLEELNVDPNNPGETTPDLVLPTGIMSSASVIGGRYAILGGIWSQYYTQNHSSNQYKDIDAFYLTPSDFQNEWQELYAGSLNDLKYVKEVSAETQNWSFYLMATVMEVYTYQVLADIYGDIPFSEALKGDEGISTPTYDNVADVYDSLIVRLDKALAKSLVGANVKDPGKSDLIFGPTTDEETPLAADMDKWVRFANTLKLKIYLRQTESRPSVASAGVQALYAAGAEFLEEDAAVDRFQDLASKSNPLFEQDQRQLNTTTNLKASKTLFSFLDENGDPRLDKLYIPGSAGQAAMNQGSFNTPTTALDPLTISRARLSATDPVYFISEAESYFLQAEAIVRGWGTGDAHALYDAGVAASFAQMGVDDAADFTADGGPYEYASYYDNTELGTILVQKWAALAGTHQGIEAFFERMRTDYPLTTEVYHTDGAYIPGYIVYPLEGTTTGSSTREKVAKHLFYPLTEVNRNPNTPTQLSLTAPLWFHQ